MTNRRDTAASILLGIAGLLAVGWAERPADEADNGAAVALHSPAGEPERSPLDVAIAPDRRFAATTNHTADSLSLVDLQEGRVVSEVRCGKAPVDAAWIDADTLIVSLLQDDAIVLLARHGRTLEREATIPVGRAPRGIALVAPKPGERPDRAFVALSGIDEVAVLDLTAREVIRHIEVGGDPRTLAVAPNQKWLLTCCNRPGEVFVHDTSSYAQLSRRNVFDRGFNLGEPAILPDSSACIVPGPINRTFPIDRDNIEKGWAIDNRLTRLPLPDGEYWQQKQMNLDVRGDAAGDPEAAVLSPDAEWLAVTVGGSHELLVLDRERIPWPPADPGDFIPEQLLYREGAFRRVELGGRPVRAAFLDENRVVVANYFLNALQIVDVRDAELVQTISLGGPPTPSLARRGEMIFYDADRSFNSWFSCHTCHTDGHTAGQVWDTLNDGNYDTAKLTPSLRGVTQTRPWTWHGWQDSLRAQMRKSMRETLSTAKPLTDTDVDALLAFLGTLEHPPSPHRRTDGTLTAAARRGKRLFHGKAGCAACHQPPRFTTAGVYEVGLHDSRQFYDGYNPPSLRGLHTRRRFLHDGRAESLQEVLTRHHRSEDLAGEALTDRERQDLIAWLKSL